MNSIAKRLTFFNSDHRTSTKDLYFAITNHIGAHYDLIGDIIPSEIKIDDDALLNQQCEKCAHHKGKNVFHVQLVITVSRYQLIFQMIFTLVLGLVVMLTP